MYSSLSPVCKEERRPTETHFQALLQILNFASVMASGLMIWKGLGLLTNTESPIVVVLRYICNHLLDNPSG